VSTQLNIVERKGSGEGTPSHKPTIGCRKLPHQGLGGAAAEIEFLTPKLDFWWYKISTKNDVQVLKTWESSARPKHWWTSLSI